MKQPYNLKRPKGVEDYVIRRLAINTYLIFDRKKDTCRCTRCGATHKISKIQYKCHLAHNEKSECPGCHNPAIAKEARYGRKGLTEYGRILWTTKRGNATYAQLDEFNLSFEGEEPKVYFWPSAQYKLTKKEQLYFKNHPGWCFGDRYWEQRKRVSLPQAEAPRNYWAPAKYWHTAFYPIIRLGTDLKYADINLLEEYRSIDAPFVAISYFSKFLKWQSIELLWKAGFKNIVYDRIGDTTTHHINWRATEIRKILKLNNAELRELKEIAGDICLLEKYKEIKKRGYDVTMKQLTFLTSYEPWEQLKKLNEYTPYKKGVKYVETQKGYVSDYLDYLGECKKLGLNLKDKKILRPEDLMEAHRETTKKVVALKNKINNEKFQKAQLEITKMSEPFIFGKYLIRPAKDAEELARESEKLNHCVRTYADLIVKGSCAILFIRKVDKPNAPFYTLELSPKRTLVQCRGENNCSYPDDIKNFIDIWLKDLNKKKTHAA